VKEPDASLDCALGQDMPCDVERKHTSSLQVSALSKLTIGRPPSSISVRFCGRNRATTLILFDMIAGPPTSRSHLQVGQNEGREVSESIRRLLDRSGGLGNSKELWLLTHLDG
jgi:hypothetical protein